eukprot:3050590-Rhodomonas_salina.1
MRPSAFDQRHHSVLDQVPDVVAPHIDVSREFPIDGVLGNLDAGGVVLPDLRRGCWFNAEPSQDGPQVYHLLTRHRSRDVFRLG